MTARLSRSGNAKVKLIIAVAVLAICLVWLVIYAASCSKRNQTFTSRDLTPAQALAASLQEAMPENPENPDRYGYAGVGVVTEDADGDPETLEVKEFVLISGDVWNAEVIAEIHNALDPVIDSAPAEQREVEVRWELQPRAPY